MTLPKGAWGRHKVCTAPGCGFRWHANGMWRHPCPACKQPLQFTEDHWTATDADRRAAEVRAGREAVA